MVINMANLLYHQDIILKKLKLSNSNSENEITIFNMWKSKKWKDIKKKKRKHSLERLEVNDNDCS